uniref:Retrotransposon protein, putative, Ty1-copia subclass n=1 Tax=Tanacetum cinerariifolium TaxID=118510 RepID=A0A6L2LUR6_TANCI|nr:retrotransposon protein, putative, Ty1-copia subclass [Tanacetum cinerariifolium]
MVPGLFYLEYEGIIAYTLWGGHAMACELNDSVEEKDSLAQVWHKRLGDISEAGLQVLEKQGLFGKKRLSKLDFCKNYVLGKSHRVSLSVGRHTTLGVIDYVHSNLWGPSQVESLGGKRYFLSIVDDYSRRVWVYILSCRDATAEWLAERMNRTLMDKVRCLLIRSGLPKTFWAEATCKLKLRAIKCVLLRYPEGVKGYILYRLDDESPKLVTSRNVVFNERVMYKDTLKDSGVGADKSIKELLRVELQRLNNHTPDEDQTYQEDGDDEDEGEQETDRTPDLTYYQLAWDREQRTRTKPLRFQDESNMDAYAFVAAEEEDTHEPKNKTWELLDHPARQKLVSCKWLFKIKEGIEGVQKPRYKVRLVAHGFTQMAGNDYSEVLYSVVRYTFIQVIHALTACKDYELEQLDVKTAFLHGNLKEVIYMRQPRGYKQEDMLIACKIKAGIGFTKSLLKKEFDMKELEDAKKILGMEIVKDQSQEILRVSQSGYVSKILNNYRIDNGKSAKMPLGGHFKLSLKDCPVKDCDVERMSKVTYANAVGSLMYMMVCTRPDIAYAVSVVGRYLVNSGKNYWGAVKWILKYLRGIANVGLVYGIVRGNHVDVTGFVDSDYAKDPDKGRSITGYAFLVQGCVVSWKAMLQHVVALSTTEAEYMALTKAVKEAIWLRGLLKELGV